MSHGFIKAHVHKLHIGAFRKYFGTNVDIMVDATERPYVEVPDPALLNEPDILACIQQGLISHVMEKDEEDLEVEEMEELETPQDPAEDETLVADPTLTPETESSVETAPDATTVPESEVVDSENASAGQNSPDASAQQTPFEDRLTEVDKLPVAKAKEAIADIIDKDFLGFVMQHASKTGTKQAAEERLKELG